MSWLAGLLRSCSVCPQQRGTRSLLLPGLPVPSCEKFPVPLACERMAFSNEGNDDVSRASASTDTQ
eukprot:5084843-Prorocentrum_lima.AAC.1